MPKMKVPDDDLDIDALEEAEYSDQDFPVYDGPEPKKGTILVGVVQKIWWTYTAKDDPMLKVLWVADGNLGDKEQFEGLTIWDNITINPSGKFRWKPFIDTMGLTLRDIKNKIIVADDDDPNLGAPITKIANWAPDTDPAYCRILTDRERYEGEWKTKVGKYLPYEDPEDEDEPEAEDEVEEEIEAELEEEELEEEEGEDEDAEEEEAEEEPPAKPARRSTRTTAKPAAAKPAAAKPARATRSSATPAAAKAASSAATPATRGGRTARTATTAAKPATKAAGTRGRRGSASAGADEEPPF